VTAELAESARAAVDGEGVRWLRDGIACDIPLPAAANRTTVEARLRAAIQDIAVDVVVCPTEGRRKQLLVADMDSTMIEQECIDELAAEMNIKERIAAITEAAMRGELDFAAALRERVSLLKGLDTSLFRQIVTERITLMPGGRALIHTMRAHGAYCALVSGGFTVFTEQVSAMLGFDEHHANRLVIDGGKLNGCVVEPILGAEAKRTTLRALRDRLGLLPDQTMAVGDGANDLLMVADAGLGIAYHAKPTLADAADVRINHGDLTALLYVQGYHQNDFAV